MSKITCECGTKVIDSTDYQSWKAHLIADQDYFNFRDLIVNKSFQEQNQFFHKYLNSIFECSSCGNLILFKSGQRYDYSSIQKHKPSTISLQSMVKTGKEPCQQTFIMVRVF